MTDEKTDLLAKLDEAMSNAAKLPLVMQSPWAIYHALRAVVGELDARAHDAPCEGCTELRQLCSTVCELQAQQESTQSRIVAIGAAIEAEKSAPGPGEAPSGHVPWCPQCGPFPRIDEDGLCCTCGATTGKVPSVVDQEVIDEALARLGAISTPAATTILRTVKDWRDWYYDDDARCLEDLIPAMVEERDAALTELKNEEAYWRSSAGHYKAVATEREQNLLKELNTAREYSGKRIAELEASQQDPPADYLERVARVLCAASNEDALPSETLDDWAKRFAPEAARMLGAMPSDAWDAERKEWQEQEESTRAELRNRRIWHGEACAQRDEARTEATRLRAELDAALAELRKAVQPEPPPPADYLERVERVLSWAMSQPRKLHEDGRTVDDAEQAQSLALEAARMLGAMPAARELRNLQGELRRKEGYVDALKQQLDSMVVERNAALIESRGHATTASEYRTQIIKTEEQRDVALVRAESAEQERNQLRAVVANKDSEIGLCSRLCDEATRLRAERDDWRKHFETASAKVITAERERDEAIRAKELAQEHQSGLRRERDIALRDRDTAIQDKNLVAEERDKFKSGLVDAQLRAENAEKRSRLLTEVDAGWARLGEYLQPDWDADTCGGNLLPPWVIGMNVVDRIRGQRDEARKLYRQALADCAAVVAERDGLQELASIGGATIDWTREDQADCALCVGRGPDSKNHDDDCPIGAYLAKQDAKLVQQGAG